MQKRMLRVLGICMVIMLLMSNSLAETTVLSLKDDFYDAVNAEWLATAQIPPDMPMAADIVTLMDKVEEALTADFTAMLSGEKEPGNENLASFIEYYRLNMDYETRNAAGAEPLKPYMEMVENLESLEDFAGQWAEWELQGMPAPFAAGVTANMGDAANNALHITAPGLFLLDKSYYADEATKGALQGLYAQMCVNLLVMAGKTEAEAGEIVTQALQFDESLVPYAKSAEEASIIANRHNPMDFAEFDAQVEAFDFTASFGELLGGVPETIVCIDPVYFAAFDEVVNEDTFPALKSWLLVQTVNGFAPLLSYDMFVESGSFMAALQGLTEAPSPERAAYDQATATFGEVVGLYYGQTYFGEEAKTDITNLAETLIKTFENRLSANTWLSEETKAMAIKKLNAIAINVGYPDRINPVYDQLRTVPAAEGGTLIGNAMEFNRLVKLDNYRQWNQPVDRGLWITTANTVNAYYYPSGNGIFFPAGFLQAPYYSLEQSASENYGGIGAVIAHEITHAFDSNGALFDEFGSVANWWTEEDQATFAELTQTMVAQFDGVQTPAGPVNATLTVTENISDAGGLACALEAVKQLEDADLEAFFTNYARIWRWKSSPEYDAMALAMDVHARSKLRVNMQLPNMDDFFTTFDIQEGDGMYRAPEDRVNIW